MRQIAALVLTFDQNHEFADHMIFKFDQLWPDNPFVFHIPYQEKVSVKRSGPIECVRTNSPIVETVLTLLSPIPDSEWVFWSMDDHFPVKLDVAWLNGLLQQLWSSQFSDVDGVNYCASSRKKRLWRNAIVREGRARRINNDCYVDLHSYDQIWLPQFIRAGALRHFFERMPEPKLMAKEMDYALINITKFPEDILLLTCHDRAVFGESSQGGCYTSSFIESASNSGFPIDTRRLAKGIIKKRTRGRWGPQHLWEKYMMR